MAQINPTVGAITANTEKIIHIIQAHQANHDVIIFPELALTGYPPEDLLFRHEFFQDIQHALAAIKASTSDCHIIIGHPCLENDKRFNSASIMANGTIVGHYHKQHLPNYGVFDEQRYFTKGPPIPCVLTIKNHRLGLCICEDVWLPGPVEALIAARADIIMSINASPFEKNKYLTRESLLRTYAQSGVSMIYVNQVGGQDELVFDGQSFVLDPTGAICARAPAFVEHLQTITWQGAPLPSEITPLLTNEALIYQALVCGLRDYVQKNNFPGVLLGLSGGVDSALTLSIAVDALGAERVQVIFMPSRYTADISEEDALLQAETMRVSYTTIPIEPLFTTYLTSLAPSFQGLPQDATEENLQARIRGTLLMAFSNKTGKMLLTTSNKSECAVGYSTLYGDMAGGFAVLKDVLKTTVYDLAHHRNSLSPVIPLRVLTRAPSAELAINQKDQDHLPDYALLDEIITHYMEERLSADEIIQCGYPAHDVLKTIHLIQKNEYKRHQAAPGIKITACAFGRDWRYPITSGFKTHPHPKMPLAK
jgi:NAD+ synthase (glutamine-hydrolysing)